MCYSYAERHRFEWTPCSKDKDCREHTFVKKFLGGFCALISLYSLNLKDLRSCLASLRKLSHPCRKTCVDYVSNTPPIAGS